MMMMCDTVVRGVYVALVSAKYYRFLDFYPWQLNIIGLMLTVLFALLADVYKLGSELTNKTDRHIVKIYLQQQEIASLHQYLNVT